MFLIIFFYFSFPMYPKWRKKREI